MSVALTLDMEDTEDTPRTTELLLARGSLLLVDENGEVIGIQNAPDGAAEVADILAWYGPAKRRHEAKVAALKTERDTLLKEINDHFNPQIREQEGALAWMERTYFPVLKDFARRTLDAMGGTEKSFKAALMRLGFRLSGGGIEVLDERTAVQWAKLTCPAAIKESLLKSNIPDDMKLPEGASGMKRIPKEDVFYVK